MVDSWSRVIQDRYRVDRELGHRGAVSTWLVTNLKSVTPCVLKCLREADAPPGDARLFETQARILAALEHPGLPRLVEYFVVGEGSAREHILIMRYHPGESLARLVTKGRLLNETQAIALLRRLVPILSYLHGLDPPLLHRGIKPSNIIVGPDGRPCLTDLHFAVEEEGGKAWEEPEADATDAPFAAPEVALGGATPASDLHALGMALIFGMTGRDPATVVRDGGRQRIREATGAGEAFAAILARMVDPAPERRYPDVRALEADLARLAAGRGPAAAPQAPTPQPKVAPSPSAPSTLPAQGAPPARAGAGETRRGSPLRLAGLLVLLAAAAAMLWLNAARRTERHDGSLLAPPPGPAREAAPSAAPAAVPSAAPAPSEVAPPAAPTSNQAGEAPPAAPASPAPEAPASPTPATPPSEAPAEKPVVQPPAPTATDASPVVAEGTLLYDGRPVTATTSLPPTFWFRNAAKGTPEKPQVDYRDGAFRLRGLPAGKMVMGARVNLDRGNPNLYPGDLDAWTNFVVGDGAPAPIEINLRKVIHLKQPVDNAEAIRGADEPCGAGNVHPGRVVFAWEPLDPAAKYEATVDRLACGRNYAPAGRVFSASTAEPWVKVELPPNPAGECYSFRVAARKEGRPIGVLTIHGREVGWDYRFTVK